MKKVLTLLVLTIMATLVVLLVGCGKQPSEQEKDESQTEEISVVETEEETTEEETVAERATVYARSESTVYFGKYPQSKVTDEEVISTLTAQAGALPEGENTQNFTNYRYTSFYNMWYIDLDLDGEQYRGVYFTSYRPSSCKEKSSSATGSYQDDNGYETGTLYWFKYEPIKWRILTENNGEAMIFADIALDSQQYNYGFGSLAESNHYANSTIRSWLNATFYQAAFNTEEQAKILTTTVDNSARSANPQMSATYWYNGENPNVCANTEDKIFLLSEQEVTNGAYGFNATPSAETANRQKYSSDYAQAQGLYLYNECCMWWLRSPCSNTNHNAYYVDCLGNAEKVYGTNVYETSIGVVPALRLTTVGIGIAEKEIVTEAATTAEEETTVDDTPAYTRDGDTVYFGSYPQSEVTDPALRRELNAQAGAFPTASNAFGFTSYGYYANGTQFDYMWYIDVSYNGVKYRGVYFTTYRPFRCDWESVADNSYQDDNGYGTEMLYWFRYDPIKWRILTEKDGKATLLADLVLDSQQYDYNPTDYVKSDNNYAASTIRKWLNETFYETAFNEKQQAKILTTTVDNSLSSTGYTGKSYICANTDDKVFLLSYKEVTNAAYGFDSNQDRQMKASDYSKIQGANIKAADEFSEENVWFWLQRSPDLRNDKDRSGVRVSNYLGYADMDFVGAVSTAIGVVPAVQIDLNDAR